MMHQFVSVDDVPDIGKLLSLAHACKAAPFADREVGKQKRLGLLFLNPSLRTRVSTQIAAENLGYRVTVLNASQDNWAMEFTEHAVMNGITVEHIRDAGPVLGAYFDVLGVRSFPSLKSREEDEQENIIKQIQKYSGLPVISLESATLHPLQSLADIMTIQECCKEVRKPKIVLSWAPHIKPIPHCVANSFAQWVNAWGEADFTIVQPEGMELNETYTKGAQIEYDRHKALEGADFVYLKNWCSYKKYGQPGGDPSWMMEEKDLRLTNSAKIMHCLPVRRNVEVSEQILDHPNCITSLQAANRVWAAQAVLSQLAKFRKA